MRKQIKISPVVEKVLGVLLILGFMILVYNGRITRTMIAAQLYRILIGICAMLVLLAVIVFLVGMSLRGNSKPLREAVKARFYPFAEARGFVREKNTHPLFTTFRRLSGNGLHVIDVQWDKYYRPQFVINFGECPAGGVEFAGKRIQAGEINPSACPRRGRLQREKGRMGGTWLQLRKPLREAITSLRWEYSPEQVVDELIRYFPEVEAWWAEKKLGPHVVMLPPHPSFGR